MKGFDDLMMDEEIRDDKPNNFIGFVVDHSGSMSSVKENARTDFNEKLAQIKKDSYDMNNYVTIVEFDGRPKMVCENEDINNISELDEYWIGGTTALYDAINKAIIAIESKMPKDGNNAAIVTIITDGYENASVEFNGNAGRVAIKKRIQELQETDRWTFVFMGADQDVLETAVKDLGIYAVNTMSYDNDSKGIANASATYSMSYENYANTRRMGATASKKFFSNDKGNNKYENTA